MISKKNMNFEKHIKIPDRNTVDDVLRSLKKSWSNNFCLAPNSISICLMADSRKSTIFPYFTKYSILGARLLTHKHTNSRLFYLDNEIKISQK